MSYHQVQVDVKVTDPLELRAYSLKRALEADMTEAQFAEGECEDVQDNIDYWLGWAFDAGTPKDCGFEIQGSRTVYEGE